MNDYIAGVLQSQYTHSMTVKRNIASKTDYGETIASDGPVPVVEGVPCKFTLSTKYNAKQTETANQINYTAVVLCSPSIDVKAGDEITIQFGMRHTYDFLAGEPHPYTNHQEVPLYREGEA